MAKRLLPTGFCWCGCGTETDRGSFFLAGHDKKAEARVIMEVFGGVPQFLVAFGYEPGGTEAASTGTWVEHAMRLAGLPARTAISLEFTNSTDRAGPLLRANHASLSPVSLADGAASFTVSVPGGAAANTIAIPFVDLRAVYNEPSRSVVRVAGALKLEDGKWYYVALGPGCPAGSLRSWM